MESGTYEEWLQKIRADLDIANVQLDRAPSFTYFYVRRNDGEIVGMINIRLFLNDFLKREGGDTWGVQYSALGTQKGLRNQDAERDGLEHYEEIKASVITEFCLTGGSWMKIYQVDAFTEEPFRGGNPAIVCVLDSAPSEKWMQDVAAEMNLPETAFLIPVNNAYTLRWFTPNSEVDLCGHATLASAHILWERGDIWGADQEAVSGQRAERSWLKGMGGAGFNSIFRQRRLRQRMFPPLILLRP